MKDDPSNLSMMELFRVEAENQTAELTSGLLELEKVARGQPERVVSSASPPSTPLTSSSPGEGGGLEGGEGHKTPVSELGIPSSELLESLMRAAHSLKGAARIVNIPSAVRVAHAMEDCFVAAQAGQLELRQPHIDLLLRGVDLLANISKHAGETELETGAPELGTLPAKGSVPSSESRVASLGVEDFVSAVARLKPGPGKAESKSPGDKEGHKVESRKHREKTETLKSTSDSSASASASIWPSPTSKPPPGEMAEREVEGGKGHKTTPVRQRSSDLTLSPEAIPPSTRHPALATEPPDRVLRLTAENLNRLLGLAGESLVESRWLRPFAETMQRLKRMQTELERALEGLRERSIWPSPANSPPHPREISSEKSESSLLPSSSSLLGEGDKLEAVLSQCREAGLFLAERLQELDLFERRTAHLSSRLYLEVLRTRMRPFADGTRRFARMVRDLARSLGKQARLEIVGENTQVDRDILDRLETPLAHLLRNALDHGCELPQERLRAGKPAEGTIRVEARHSAGMLLVTVADDGAGLDTEKLREKLKAESRKQKPGSASPFQLSAFHISALSEAELLQFLFLPGFSLRESVTELSGRGVGLDVVQNMVRSVRGSVKVIPLGAGRGMKFQLQLPLTMSVLRTLLVEVGGEPYAFPLAQIAQTCQLPWAQIESLEGRQYFKLGEQPVGLVAGRQVFGPLPLPSVQSENLKLQTENSLPSSSSLLTPKTSELSPFQYSAFCAELPIVVLGEASRVAGRYGLVVDRFLGERELVVQPLDPRLGKVQDISAAALMEDGTPVLIVDVDDLLRSIEKLVREGTIIWPSMIWPSPPSTSVLSPQVGGGEGHRTRDLGTGRAEGSFGCSELKRKRILAVDDSLTVRELERKLLTSRGYVVEVAVDGMEGWNAVRTGGYDLVITDVDMPRMDGIRLVSLIKGDEQLKSLPVMIVSYKDREEDRLRGLAAGADYYLTKGSFADDTLLQAVLDLIGEPDA